MTPLPMPEPQAHFPSLAAVAAPVLAWLETHIGPVPVEFRHRYLETEACGVNVKAWLYDDRACPYLEWRLGFSGASQRSAFQPLPFSDRAVPASVLIAAALVAERRAKWSA